MNKIDVHVIEHPNDDRTEKREKVLEQLRHEPVNVYVVKGTHRVIGRGRYKGFKSGDESIVSYVDDDDQIIPGIFDDILEAFENEPELDGVCTREVRNIYAPQGRIKQFPFKYYDRRHLFRIHHITAYKRSSIDPHLEFIRNMEDCAEHSLAAKVLYNNGRIKHIPKAGYVWTVHEGSTPSLKLKKPEKALALYKALHNKAVRENFKSHIPEQGLIR